MVSGDKITGEVVNVHTTIQQIHTKEKLIPRMSPPLPRVFTGRDDLIMELLGALDLNRDDSRFDRPITLTLKGMGGVGKTAVATVLAHEPMVQERLGDGVLWAHLGPKPDLMTWLATWGDQLGLDVANYTDVEARSRALGTFLHDRKLLVVLDDVWRESDAAHFLVVSPGCRIVVTTRDVSVAANLSSGPDTFGASVEPLSPRVGLRLLREFAAEAVSADPETTEKLVTTLGGLPLSLTLAGQMIAREWSAGLGMQGALDELMGTSGQTDQQEGESVQSSLRAMLSVGYDHLPDDEVRRVFRQLGVFGGQPLTFAWQAAADIWELPRRRAQRHIATLVDQQMVQPLGEGLYSLHNSFADFAWGLLQEDGDLAAVQERFVTHYMEMAQEKASLDWCAVESALPQIRRAFGWLADEKRLADVAQFIQIMNRFFTRRGLWDSLTDWTETAMKVADEAGQKTISGQLNNNLAYICYQQADWQTALEYYEQGLEIFEELGDQIQQAVTLSNMGSVYSGANMLDEALNYYEQSQEIFEQAKDWPRLASTLNDVGTIYRRLEDPETALSYHDLGLKLYEGLGDEAGRARTLNQLGAVYDSLDELDDALACYEQAHQIFVKNGNLIYEGVSLYNMAMLYRYKGDVDQAIEAMKRVVSIDEQLARPDLDADQAILDELYTEQRNQGSDE